MQRQKIIYMKKNMLIKFEFKETLVKVGKAKAIKNFSNKLNSIE